MHQLRQLCVAGLLAEDSNQGFSMQTLLVPKDWQPS